MNRVKTFLIANTALFLALAAGSPLAAQANGGIWHI